MLTDIVTRFDDSKRMLASLLAKENISVQVIAGAHTASFDMVARVLTIPDWSSLTIDQVDLLIGHETGHANFTDLSYLEGLATARRLKKHPGLMTYFNVVEDARIERKMREAYPGLRKSFYDGYKTFTTDGPIFAVTAKGTQVDGQVVKDLSLIDRINLFYKLGAFIAVPFAADEVKWMPLIDKAWSTERALEIARELHELAKDDILKEQEKQKDAQKNQPKQKGEKGAGSGEPVEPSDDEAGDEDGDEDESSDGDQKSNKKDGKRGKSGDGTKVEDESGEGDSDDSEDGDNDADDADAQSGTDGEDTEHTDSKKSKDKAADKASKAQAKADRDSLDPSSTTDKALADILKKLAEQAAKQPNNQIRHLLLKPVDEQVVRDRTITNAKWVSTTMANLQQVNASGLDKSLAKLEQKWNDQYLSTAQNMAQEFLQRKTAKNLQHARTGRTGRLDMNKLPRYKFADDLFKRVMTVPNGQSHGLVMIIDGSGSMANVFGQVLDQVLLFANFAYRVNMPFECYLFNDTNSGSYREHTLVSTGLQSITIGRTGTLVGLVNTSTGRATFKTQIQAVLAMRCHYVGTGGVSANLSNIPYVSLGGTPLFTGMMLAERHVERMKRTMRLDKVMTVVISDGQDNGGLWYETQTVDKHGKVVKDFEMVGTTGIVVRDTVTKKNHVLITTTTYSKENYIAPENTVMTLMFDVLKTRHGSRNIYIYIAAPRSIDARAGSAPMNAIGYLRRAGVEGCVQDTDVQKSMNATKQFVMPKALSIADCAMVIRPAALELTESEFSKWNADGATQKKVASEFVKSMVKATTNRLFVNTVIPFIA